MGLLFGVRDGKRRLLPELVVPIAQRVYKVALQKSRRETVEWELGGDPRGAEALGRARPAVR